MKKFLAALLAVLALSGVPAYAAPSGPVGSVCTKVPLAAVDTAGGVFSWKNREPVSVIVTRVVLNVTTKSTAASTLDIGQTATSATTSSDNLMDGVDVGTAAGVFDSISERGTNGKSRQVVAAGKWVTASKASGATAGLVGSAYICYMRS